MTHAIRFSEPVEYLESRTLLAADPPGTLTVRGTNTGDIIQIDIRRASDGTKVLKVNITGVQRTFDLTGISTIQIESLDGNDTVIVRDSVVRPILINGGLGDDLITGGAGDDRLIGGRGFDRLNGGDGRDYLKGYDNDDFLQGNGGNDTIEGGNGNDTMRGNSGDDSLNGGAGIDQMFGDDGSDRLVSQDSQIDTVNGGDGDDTLVTSDLIDAVARF
jgi:Ca2+-binding RTX toxin-like protein